MAGQGCLVPPSTVLAGGALQTRVSSDLLEQSLDIPLVSRVGAVSSFHPIKGAGDWRFGGQTDDNPFPRIGSPVSIG